MLNESLVRKHSLKQLTDIDNLMNLDGNKNDIGELTSYEYPTHVDTKQNDNTTEEIEKMANEFVGIYGWGQFGEMYGDMTNDEQNANILFARNPLHNDYMANFEDTRIDYNWMNSWVNYKGKDVQKFDQPDDSIQDNLPKEWDQKKATKRQGIKPGKDWLWDRNGGKDVIRRFDEFDEIPQPLGGTPSVGSKKKPVKVDKLTKDTEWDRKQTTVLPFNKYKEKQ